MIEPSFQAIDAAAHTEATEVEKIMNKGEGEPTPWRNRSEESKRHWRAHVGAAVRAAYAVDFPSEGPGAVIEIKRGFVSREVCICSAHRSHNECDVVCPCGGRTNG